MNLKKIVSKSIASFMATTILFGNFSMCGMGISKVIAENLAAPEIEIQIENQKYVQYNYTEIVQEEVEGENEGETVMQDVEKQIAGVAIQSKLSVKPTQTAETYLSTQSVNLSVSMPRINEYLPVRATVVTASTKYTTGEESKNINQSYDATTGLLSVSYENVSDEQGNIYANFNEDAKDEFEIIYIYPAEAYVGNETDTVLNYTVSAEMVFVTENGTVESIVEQTIELTEKDNKEDITSFKVTNLKENIYKGFMYSNIENKTSHDTGFTTVSTFAVLNSDIAKETFVEENANQLILKGEEDVVVSANENVGYNSTTILKSEFDKILGQENSFVEFYQGEEIFATVAYVDIDETKKIAITYKDAEPNILEDGVNEIVINYPENTTNLKIKISKPIAEGFINFENRNKIKASEDYGYAVEDIKSILLTTSINEKDVEAELILSEPSTKVSINSSNANFSTLQQSSTTLTINLDDTNITTKLFNAPKLTVKLPEGIKNFNIAEIDILNGNGLTIKKYDIINNTIVIELSGTQTAFDFNNVSGGANIVMDIENIEYADTIPAHSDKIELVCSQDNVKADCNVNIVSRSGLLMLTKLTGFDENGSLVTTLDNSSKSIEIENGKEQKKVNKKVIFVNNFDKEIEDVKIIGKLGNTESTFNVTLKEAIRVNKENAKVYYSNNIEATYDDESWTEEYTELAKAYKVVLNENKLASNDNLEIDLNLNIPEKLGYNQLNSLSTGIKYIYEGQERKEINNIYMKTPEIEEALETNLYANRSDIAVGVVTKAGGEEIENGNEVFEGQILKAKVTIRNNSSTEATYKILTTIENAVYYELFRTGYIYNQTGAPDTRYGEAKEGDVKREKEIKIPANSSIDYEYQYVVSQGKDKVVNKINVLDTNNNNVIEEIKIENSVKPAKMKLLFKYAYNEESPVYSSMNAVLYIKNLESKDLKNIKTQVHLSEQLSVNTYEYYGDRDVELIYDDETNILDINVDKIKENETLELLIVFDVNIDVNSKQEKVSLNASCEYMGEKYLSNDFSKTAHQSKTDLNMNVVCDSINRKVQKGDKIKYTVDITNSGVLDLKGSTLIYTTPEGIKVDSAEVIYSDGTKEVIEIDTNNRVSKELDIKKNDNIRVIYNATVYSVSESMESRFSLSDIYWNTVTRTSKLIGEIKVENNDQQENNDDNLEQEPADGGAENPGNNNQGNNQGNNNNNNNQEQNKTYSISGIAWLDSNKNGQRDADERLMENIPVNLVDKATGNKVTASTSTKGEYKFENIAEGTYSVIFEVDTNKYIVTTYQKTGVSEDINSDVILTKSNVNGQEKLVGITNEIELKSDKLNIDIGLIENAIFDLSLDKTISKVTVINKKGTETTEYEDGETAKVDLVAKYMNGAEVIVTYKFTVKNVGDTVGYVDKLVDNLPSGLEFSSELNSEWYKGSDNQLYTTQLSGKAIKPGETTEVELVLTKKMTENNTGVFPNNAELLEISNLENIKEKEEALENNKSSAMLFISIKTGSVILYIGITIACITILALGAYIIKKKVLNRAI